MLGQASSLASIYDQTSIRESLFKRKQRSMNNFPLWAQIIILLLGSGTIGGIAGALSPIFTAQLAYRQKMHENMIANARTHIETLYLPIDSSLSGLAEKYEYYKSCKRSCETAKFTSEDEEQNISIKAMLQQARDEFLWACKDYIRQRSEISSQGDDAYLIPKLEEGLRSFTNFLKTSMISPTVQKEMDEYTKGDEKYTNSLFEQHFMSAIHDLKSYIKEVTLGGQVNSNNQNEVPKKT